MFVGCNQSGQLLTMDQLLRAATQRNRQIFLRRNCYIAKCVSPSRLKSKHCSVNSFQGSSLQIDSCQENLFVLITVIVLLLKELKGLNLVESFPRHLCIVASLSSKPPQSPLAPFASVFLAPLLPCWVLICLWQSWHHHRSARSQFLTWLSAECQKP